MTLEIIYEEGEDLSNPKKFVKIPIQEYMEDLAFMKSIFDVKKLSKQFDSKLDSIKHELKLLGKQQNELDRTRRLFLQEKGAVLSVEQERKTTNSLDVESYVLDKIKQSNGFKKLCNEVKEGKEIEIEN
jgi:hypothetical protein